MQKTYHFISGLPRSGSTLLAGILRQNPRFEAGISSPLNGLHTTLLNAMSLSPENATTLGEKQKRRVLQGLFDSFYADVDRPVIFDTNRMWTARLWAVSDFFPDAKVVCCVRNVAWIMDSFERAVRRNPLDVSRLFNDESERNTIYARVDTLGQRNRPVGSAWSALKEAYYGEHSHKLLLVEYDLLAKKPRETVDLIYDFLGEDHFAHDFNDVRFSAEAFDHAISTPGLHKVEGKVEFKARQTILPPDLFERYDGMSFWADRKGTQASVITAKRIDKNLSQKEQ